MATTKSKSTSKSKKPVKAAKAPVTTKTTNKSASKSSNKSSNVKTTVTTKTVRESLSPLERIRSLHLSLVFMYVVLAGLVIGFVVTSAVAVKMGLQVQDQFASGPNVVLAPASEVLYNIEPKYMLAAALVVSAIASALLATKLRARYEATITNRTSGLRWLAYGISAALTLEFISLASGIDDISVLKLSAFMVLLAALLSFMAERENAGQAKPKWFAYSLAIIAGALAWLPIVLNLIGTSLYGMERFGWHVYAFVVVTLIGFILVAVNQSRHLRSGGQLEYARLEEKYLRIDMITKFAIVVVAILALK